MDLHHDPRDADDPEGEDLDEPIRRIDPIHPERQAYDAERARQKYLLIIRRRRTRDFMDPFDVTYESFVKSYRLSQDIVLGVVNLIRPYVARTTSPLALPLEKKLLAVLAFYASGSYQTPTGKNYDAAVAQPTMSKYIEEITNALNNPAIVGRFIRFPENVEEVNICIERNTMLGANLPDSVAYTDGTLVKIMKPSVANNRLAFMGRKSFASMNVQITCDRRRYVNNVLARFPGSTNDSYIFNSSAVRRKMIELNALRRCHLVGDSGYALEPWMMIPFARDDRPQPNTPEGRFNACHIRDRTCVERCIGSMKNVFRVINDERVLHYDAVKTCRITVAITVLHNLRILAQVPYLEDGPQLRDDEMRNENHHDDVENENDPEGGAAVARLLLRGRAVRDRLVQVLEAARARRHRQRN